MLSKQLKELGETSSSSFFIGCEKMTKTIQFPDNYQRYLEIGKEALLEGHIQVAKENFESAYNLEQTLEANQFLVKTYMKLDGFNEAQFIADELAVRYIADEATFPIYIEVLLATNQFVKVSQLLVRKKNLNWQVSDLEKKYQLASDYYMTFHVNEQEEMLKNITNISQYSVIRQLAILKELERFPVLFYKTQGIPLLKDAKLPLVVRQGLLMEIMKLQLSDTVILLDLFGNERVISVNDFSIMNSLEIEALAQVKSHIESELEFESPEIRDQLIKEASMHFQMMFPFAHEFISDCAMWSEQFLARYLGKIIKNSKDADSFSEQETILELIQSELMKLVME